MVSKTGFGMQTRQNRQTDTHKQWHGEITP